MKPTFVQDLYNKAIRKYGVDAQLDMAVEEMSELIKEICKYKRHRKHGDRIADEVADVEIMLEQIVFMLNNEGLKNKFKERKLNRLYSRVKRGYYKISSFISDMQSLANFKDVLHFDPIEVGDVFVSFKYLDGKTYHAYFDKTDSDEIEVYKVVHGDKVLPVFTGETYGIKTASDLVRALDNYLYNKEQYYDES